ncbi:MAG: hypothetical protein ACNA8S_09750 [Deferrisomatales bacterium]
MGNRVLLGGSPETARGRPAAALGTLALLALWLCSGCAFVHRYEPQCGRVVDEDTGEPIEGAAVVGMYHTVGASLGGDVKEWAATQETATDAGGEFCLPATTLFRPRLPLTWFDDEVEIWVFKPAYRLFPGARAVHRGLVTRTAPDGKTTEYPLKKLATREERRKNLQIPTMSPEISMSSRWHEYMPLYFKLHNEERRNLGLEEL